MGGALTIFADCISYEKDTFINKLMQEILEKNIINTISLIKAPKQGSIHKKKVNNLIIAPNNI